MKPLLAGALIALIPAMAAADMQAQAMQAQPGTAQQADQIIIPSPIFLTRGSNFGKFFKPGVPAAIQEEAERILWLTHPELSSSKMTASQAVSYLAAKAAPRPVPQP